MSCRRSRAWYTCWLPVRLEYFFVDMYPLLRVSVSNSPSPHQPLFVRSLRRPNNGLPRPTTSSSSVKGRRSPDRGKPISRPAEAWSFQAKRVLRRDVTLSRRTPRFSPRVFPQLVEGLRVDRGIDCFTSSGENFRFAERYTCNADYDGRSRPKRVVSFPTRTLRHENNGVDTYEHVLRVLRKRLLRIKRPALLVFSRQTYTYARARDGIVRWSSLDSSSWLYIYTHTIEDSSTTSRWRNNYYGLYVYTYIVIRVSSTEPEDKSIGNQSRFFGDVSFIVAAQSTITTVNRVLFGAWLFSATFLPFV